MNKPTNQTNNKTQALRDTIIMAMLPNVAEHGWTWGIVQDAAQEAKIQDDMVKIIFPNGLADVVAHFSDYTDRQMLDALKKMDKASAAMRSKDKVRAATLKRYELLEPHKEAVKYAMSFWAQPHHVIQGQRVLWRTADAIWTWAGDTATDYNRQTKRGLLCSILMATTMVWITDETENYMITQAFLDRRLDNVMEFGKVMGTVKNIIPNLFRQVYKTK